MNNTNNYSLPKWTATCVSFIMILFALTVCWNNFCYLRFPDINNYSWTEFLINFEGGLVRRGLLGQLIFFITEYTGLSPLVQISIICVISFVIVAGFLLWEFQKRKWAWWIILSPFMCAIPIVRKDYLLVVFLIAALLILGKNPRALGRRVAATAIIVLGLFMHEAFIFWGAPIVCLVIFMTSTNRREIVESGILILVILFSFLLLSYFKGNVSVADSIRNSWNSLFGSDVLENTKWDSIGAIGWTTGEAVKSHFNENFCSWHGFAVIVRMLYLGLTYYFVSNYLFVFSNAKLNRDSSRSAINRDVVSGIYLMCIVCLLPMFTVLSCDYGRIYFYAFMVTFVTILALPSDVISKIIPGWYRRFVVKLNSGMDRVLAPNKWILLIILLCTAPCPYSFSFGRICVTTVIGEILYFFGSRLLL